MTTSDNISAIEAVETPKNRIQGMVRSIDQYRNCDPKAIADGSYAQVLYALTDDKHDILVLWDFAVSAGERAAAEARKAEAMEREIVELRGALRPFATLAEKLPIRSDGRPDSKWLWVYDGVELSYGDFRRARTLLNGGSDAQE
ncbi:hypothetical protein [Shinella sp.]|uniref:hypothetical protein n=1 Tax=Shinella sp. TaxID=1870904 RepID=UPI003D294F7F